MNELARELGMIKPDVPRPAYFMKEFGEGLAIAQIRE